MAYTTFENVNGHLEVDLNSLYRDTCKIPHDGIKFGWYRENEMATLRSKLAISLKANLKLLLTQATTLELELCVINTAKIMLENGEITLYNFHEKKNPDPLNKIQRKW